jgi:molybdopterin synthase sulfur carrier subunit
MDLDEAGDAKASSGDAGHPRSGGNKNRTREVRFFAAAREAAGESQTYVTAGTVEELTDALVREYGDPLGRVLGVSSLLVDGQVLAVSGAGGQELPASGVVDVLPPFAGG